MVDAATNTAPEEAAQAPGPEAEGEYPLHLRRGRRGPEPRRPQARRPKSANVQKHSLAWTKFREMCDGAKTADEMKKVTEEVNSAMFMEDAQYTDEREKAWKPRYSMLMELVKKAGKAKAVPDATLLKMCDQADVHIGDLLHACVTFECPIPTCIGQLYKDVAGGPRLGGHHVAREIVEGLRHCTAEELNESRIETARELIKWHAIVCDDFDYDAFDDLQTPFMIITLLIVMLVLSVPLLTVYWGHGLDFIVPSWSQIQLAIPQFISTTSAAAV
eukprot:TRINITY_DN25538_c0_g1_i1.p1 TRINITY_DN25538_c0_g1~~TRINITY_DN25538_c0_g1_i1.p1  ORF type:complete len:288 (+),score=107.57 TRINITY_DN25538_c0_g1_i1:44-865(+)